MTHHNYCSSTRGRDQPSLLTQLATKHKLLTNAFLAFDADRSGHITRDELEAGIQHFNLGIPVEHVAQIADALDTDGDGKISYEEFASQLHSKEAQYVDLFGHGEPVEDNLLSWADPRRVGNAHDGHCRGPPDCRQAAANAHMSCNDISLTFRTPHTPLSSLPQGASLDDAVPAGAFALRRPREHGPANRPRVLVLLLLKQPEPLPAAGQPAEQARGGGAGVAEPVPVAALQHLERRAR